MNKKHDFTKGLEQEFDLAEIEKKLTSPSSQKEVKKEKTLLKLFQEALRRPASKSQILATVFSNSIIQMKNLKNCAILQKECT